MLRFMIGFILLTSPGLLSAQSDQTAVEGTVVDSSSLILVGADVFLEDTSSGLAIHQVTDSEDRFQFVAKPGNYQVTAAMSGFDSVTQNLTLTQTKPADLHL